MCAKRVIWLAKSEAEKEVFDAVTQSGDGVFHIASRLIERTVVGENFVVGLPPSMSAALIRKALSKMKCCKAAGSSGIITEILKAAGEEGVELTRQLTQAVFSNGKIPLDWEESFILNLFKGDALERGNYLPQADSAGVVYSRDGEH